MYFTGFVVMHMIYRHGITAVKTLELEQYCLFANTYPDGIPHPQDSIVLHLVPGGHAVV